ncbi:uncharacterized protein PRD47_015743 isoform 1-T1 [Ara ararauna]
MSTHFVVFDVRELCITQEEGTATELCNQDNPERRKVKYETGTRSASLPHRTGTRSGSFLHAEAGDSKQELADGCIVSWWPQPYGMRFGIPIKVGIKRSGYAGGTEHAEAGGRAWKKRKSFPATHPVAGQNGAASGRVPAPSEVLLWSCLVLFWKQMGCH